MAGWDGGADALFPLMTDGTLGLAQITFQAFFGKISELPSSNVKFYCTILYSLIFSEVLQLSATTALLVLILLLPLLLPRINNPPPLYFYRWPDFFQGNKSIESSGGGSIAGNNIYPEPFVPADTFQD